MTAHVTILCANLKGNLGDYAILEMMGRSMQRLAPGRKVLFFHHANKGVDTVRFNAFLKQTCIEMTPMGAAPFFRRPYWLRLVSRVPSGQGLARLLHNAAIARCTERISSSRTFAESVTSADAVVFAGGAQWGRGNLNLNMFAQLGYAKRHNGNVIIFPFGISRAAVDCNGQDALASMLSGLRQPLPVRDGISYRLLNTIGVDTARVSDCVYLAQDMFTALRSRPTAPTRRVYVAVNQSGDTDARQIVALFDRLRAAGLEPSLFSTCEAEDRPLTNAVVAIREEPFVAPQTWKAAVHLFADAAFVITNRLHGLIFAALAGTPVVPVTNRQKARAYAEDAGLDFAPTNIVEISVDAISRYLARLDDARGRQEQFLQRSAAVTKAFLEGHAAVSAMAPTGAADTMPGNRSEHPAT